MIKCGIVKITDFANPINMKYSVYRRNESLFILNRYNTRFLYNAGFLKINNVKINKFTVKRN